MVRAQNSGGASGKSEIVQVHSSRDATLYSEDAFDGGNRGNGGGETFMVGSLQGFTRRTLMDFNLEGQVPTGALVVNARLVMKVTNASVQPFLAIFRVPGQWAEGTSTPESEEFGGEAITGDSTWLYRRYHETSEQQRLAWKTPGGDFNYERPVFQGVGEGTDSTVAFTSADFVADVQSMVSLPDQHSGWFLLGEETTFGSAFQIYASRQNEDEALRPVLEIEFTESPDVDKVVGNYDSLMTIAGTGEDERRNNDWRDKFEGGPALDANLSRPSIARAAADGTIYFTDTYAHAVRKVKTDGTIVTIAGNGVEGYNLDEGEATEVQLDQPNGLYLIDDGTFYIIDVDNDRVRKVTNGRMTTVIHDPEGIDTGRGLWVSEDEQTIVYGARHSLRQWTATEGNIEVLASGFDRLGNVDWDPASGDFLVADTDDNTVWRVEADGSNKSKIAGGGSKTTSGQLAKDMRLDGVRGVAAAGHGGYFLTAEGDGDIIYVDLEGIAHVLISGSGGGNIIGGEGEVLKDIFTLGGNRVSQPYSITIAPNGDLVITTNDTGLIRVVRKGRAPTLVRSGEEDSGTFGLAWTSQIQRLYRVEMSSNLETWTLASEVPSSRNETSFSMQIGDESMFYRVRFYYP